MTSCPTGAWNFTITSTNVDLVNYDTLRRDTSFRSDETLTSSEDLGEDAALVG